MHPKPQLPLPLSSVRSAGLLLALGAAAAATASGQTLVDFNYGFATTYVDASQALQGLSAGQIAYTSTLSPAANYTGPAFKGGSYSTTSVSTSQITNASNVFGTGTGYDLIETATAGTASVAATLSTLVLFNSATMNGQAINPGDTFSLSTAKFSFSVHYTAFATGTPAVRIVVETSPNTFIISNTLGTQITAGNAVSFTSNTLSWFDYTPSGDASNIAAIGGAASVSATTFDNVSSAGLLASATTTVSTTTQRMRIGRFAVDDATFTPVPEPSAFAALAGLGALGFAASRRRRR